MTHPDRLMKDAVLNDVFPGGVLLVSLDGATVFFEAYGSANLFAGRPMTRETVFDLASLTKPLATTLAVMHLLEHSKLSLEQGLGSILPAFNNADKKKIRIEHLLFIIPGFRIIVPIIKGCVKWKPIEEKKR